MAQVFENMTSNELKNYIDFVDIEDHEEDYILACEELRKRQY